MTSATPASASARAQPLPRPWLDAQTIAVRPRMPKSMKTPVEGLAMKAQGSYSRRQCHATAFSSGGSVTNERNSSGPRIASVTSPELLAVLEELKLREPIFHHPEFGTTRQDYEAMTDPQFWEVGASGRRYSREFV